MKQNIFSTFMPHLADWLRYAFKSLRLYLFPKSLFYRFVLIILLPLLLLQTVMLIFFYDRHWNTVSRRLAADVAGEIETMADYIVTTAPNESVLAQMIENVSNNLSLKMTFVPNTYLTQNNLSEQSNASELKKALRDLPYPVNMEEKSDGMQLISLQLPTGVLTTLVPRKRFFSSTVHVFFLWMISSFILLFLIAFLFMKNQVRSIEKLSRASELFGTGHDIAFRPSGATEVKQAGMAFILMKNRIKRYLSERTSMLSAVSHDLRTPLTRMKLQLSMMPPDDANNDLLSDISEMEKMLNGYLAFARGEGKEAPQTVMLDALVEDLVEKQCRTGQKIDLHTEEHVTVFGRLNEITRAISNILTNANRYAQQTAVTVGIRHKAATVIIDDDGPGIPAGKRREVFKAFYRLEESRNQATGGIGLGMTITRDIVLAHGGNITLVDSPLGGLRVILSFPLTRVFLPCTFKLPFGSCCTTCTAILSPNANEREPVAEFATSFDPPNPSAPFNETPNHLLIKVVNVSTVVEDFSDE